LNQLLNLLLKFLLIHRQFFKKYLFKIINIFNFKVVSNISEFFEHCKEVLVEINYDNYLKTFVYTFGNDEKKGL